MYRIYQLGNRRATCATPEEVEAWVRREAPANYGEAYFGGIAERCRALPPGGRVTLSDMAVPDDACVQHFTRPPALVVVARDA